MKAIEVATKNHITVDDIAEVCKDLEIPCGGDDHDFTEKQVFLLEKKIEKLKEKQIEAQKNKKIKLKRKVSVGSKEHTADLKKETVKDEKSIPKAEVKTETKPPYKKDSSSTGGYQRKPYLGSNPNPNYRGGGGTPRPAGSGYAGTGTPRPAGGGYGGTGNNRPASQSSSTQRPFDKTKPLDPSAVKKTEPASALIDSQKKRKKDNKGKDKEKELKDRYRRDFEEKRISHRKKAFAEEKKKEVSAPSEIAMTENISVGDLAKKLNIKAKEVIAKLMKIGVMATINQIIDADTATILSSEYGTEVKVVTLYDETIIKIEEEDKLEDYTTKPPVVTVMGHVDHGKTKLLDAIRETDIVAGEHGGITQHIGAYMVTLPAGKRITFLDTPGHAAFTTMRARGAKITDIVIIVIAVNDGVMPQTIEAINHAKAANVPIIVALNKVDLPDANIAKVKQELTAYELIPEEWGGTTLFAEISAKQKTNIDGLLELILIQSEMLELKCNAKIRAKGAVIESKLDAGRGPVCTVLVQKGALKVGDPFVAGVFSGRVRAMFDDQGKSLEIAGPSTPVEIIGITGVPSAGDPFEAVDSDKTAKMISNKRLEYKRIESAKKIRKVTLESLNEMIKEGEVQELRIIVKADVDGSAQALLEALEKLSTSEVRVKVIHAGAGGINDSDVMLASASNAIIIGYHVRPTGKVSDIADRENVSIKFYNIIFEATDAVKAAMQGMLSPEMKEEIVSTGDVKQVFKISKVGTIAGSIALTGKLDRTCRMRLIRDAVVIHDGPLKSLKRYKDDVSSVDAGQEFGFGYETFSDIKEGDTYEAYKIIEIAKVL
jgi:translation initiation factor IF-2